MLEVTQRYATSSMTNYETTKDKAKKGQRSQPNNENVGNKKLKNVAKNVIGPVAFMSKDEKQKVTGSKFDPKDNKQSNTVSSKVSDYVYEYMPEYVYEYFSKKKRNQTKRGHTTRRRSSKKNEPNKKARLTKQVCVGIFFLALLVLVFVGSAVGFSKCEPGFRNVPLNDCFQKKLVF